MSIARENYRLGVLDNVMVQLGTYFSFSVLIKKNLEEKHALRIQLEGTVEDLWRQFQQVCSVLQRSVTFYNVA